MGNNAYKRLGTNTLLVFIGNIGPKLVSFILMPFYTFWMSKEEFGIQDVILTYSTLLVPYFTLGLYEAVFVYPKGKDIKTQAQYFSNAITTVALMLVVGISIILLLPKHILNYVMPEHLQNHLPYLLCIITLDSFQRLVQSFTRGIDKMRSFSIAGIIHAIVMLVMAVTFVRQKGLIGFWYSLIAADTASIFYNFISIRGWTYIIFKQRNITYLKELLKFSIPLVPNATMWWIVNSINRPLLLSNVGLDGIGIYSVAGKFPSILSLIFTIFFSAFQISALEEFDKKSYKQFYNNVFKMLSLLMFLLTCFFILFGGFIFDIFIDRKFHEGIIYLPLLCTGVVISNLATYVGISFTVTKHTKYFLYSALIAALMAIIFNSLLIPKYGIMGACISIIISQTSMLLYRWFKSRNIVDFENYRYIVNMLLCYVIALASYYLLRKGIVFQLMTWAAIVFSLILNKNSLNIIYKFLSSKIIR